MIAPGKSNSQMIGLKEPKRLRATNLNV